MKVQVAILGGGCGGLWLLHELARDYSCLLVDSQVLARFASTRNQGWLQSGAFYAMIGEDEAASECGRGSDEWQNFCDQHCPDAVETDSGCLVLFATKEEAEETAQKLERVLQLTPRLVNRATFLKLEPVLHPAQQLRYGLLTGDHHIDTYRALTEVRDQSLAHGARFHLAETGLEALQISHAHGLWEIRDGTQEIAQAQILVYATGALTPLLLQRQTGNECGLSIQNALVAVLHQRICHNLLLVQTGDSFGLNVVPFHGGASINLARKDWLIDDPFDDEIRVEADTYAELADNLMWFVPGLLEYLPCQMHFYVCQKLNNTDHLSNPYPDSKFGLRHYFWIKPKDALYCFSPGKFTTAPIAAQELAAVLAEKLGDREPPEEPSADEAPPIAQRPYYDAATHVARLSKGVLEFEEVEGRRGS